MTIPQTGSNQVTSTPHMWHEQNQRPWNLLATDGNSHTDKTTQPVRDDTLAIPHTKIFTTSGEKEVSSKDSDPIQHTRTHHILHHTTHKECDLTIAAWQHQNSIIVYWKVLQVFLPNVSPLPLKRPGLGLWTHVPSLRDHVPSLRDHVLKGSTGYKGVL